MLAIILVPTAPEMAPVSFAVEMIRTGMMIITLDIAFDHAGSRWLAFWFEISFNKQR
jgi:hypothetical protein